ncbi:hypothetical protein HQ865_14310 [Mucilaginibacter mali]|uniref:Uncharacterized protein n=1 Tax=Mucilaginibacter mali TaxID=2740462 RepID=A0A7D4Q8R1_9SPHI|nr:hypothetical protein [Mucilaginibacter mali]QKJ30871.1 hypothetical protein HQ865_14310 [Mucilaginibacter mali]
MLVPISQQISPYFAPLLTGIISIAVAVISYYNYRLNKTLNIKNQLFNEKLKKYIELSRKIAEFVELLDIIGPKINLLSSAAGNIHELEELGLKANEIGLGIQYLIIESHMLVPEEIIKRMTVFAECQNLGLPHDLTKVNSTTYWEHDQDIRKKGEDLIMALRNDLGVEKLSVKFGDTSPKKNQ